MQKMHTGKVGSMTEGPLTKKIIRFSVPLMLSNVLQVLFNMSDVAVAGRFAGSVALGAVGSTTILVMLFTGFLIGVGSGVNVIVARFLGAKLYDDVREAVGTSFVVSLLVGLAAAGVGQCLAEPLLHMLNTKEVLFGGAVEYLRIYFMGLPALAVYNFGNAVLSAAGDTKKPLYFLASAGVINVLLNLFFVIVCGLGVAGVALASVISQYISAALILIALWRAKTCYALRFRAIHVSGKKAKLVLGLGLPAGAQNSIFSLANLFIQGGVNSFSAVVVEGNSAAANADALIYDVMAAVYTACSCFISQNFGAGKKERIKKIYVICLVFSFGIAACMSGLLVLFGREFLSLFTVEEAVIEAGMYRLMVMGFSYPFSAFMDVAIAASRGMGKSVAPTVIVLAGSCLFRIIWVYTVFAYFGTILSLYLLYISSWTITAIAESIYFRRCYRAYLPNTKTAHAL